MSASLRAAAEARVGQTIAGKYLLLKVLGVGGHGAVLEAEHTLMHRRVAIKLLLGDAAASPEYARRFLREAQAPAQCEHPNILRVLDVGQETQGDGDHLLYLVEELLEGEDLRHLLARERVLAPERALELLLPVMDGLATAHSQGIVHRDIKPANIFLARTRAGAIVPKLIDFGISKLTEGDQESLTLTGTTLGTAGYMSPEQARGDAADERSDVWSAGVVLFEALVGRRPFTGNNYNQTLTNILLYDAPRADAVNPAVPSSLATILQRALARQVSARFAAITELASALRAWQGAPEPHRGASSESTAPLWKVAVQAPDQGPSRYESAPSQPPSFVVTPPPSEASASGTPLHWTNPPSLPARSAGLPRWALLAAVPVIGLLLGGGLVWWTAPNPRETTGVSAPRTPPPEPPARAPTSASSAHEDAGPSPRSTPPTTAPTPVPTTASPSPEVTVRPTLGSARTGLLPALGSTRPGVRPRPVNPRTPRRPEPSTQPAQPQSTESGQGARYSM